ncbi:ATP-binding protein [Azoarcus sp. PA01]|nr:ATP-binding protein [Azoarcus sp. PA01]
MQTPAPTVTINPSRIPGCPTIVLVAPQGCGKTLFSKVLAMKLGCSYVIEDGEINGVPVSIADHVPHDGGLVLGRHGERGGDLTITAHTEAGFHALLRALRIPLTHRLPYSTESAPGPGPEFEWDADLSNRSGS